MIIVSVPDAGTLLWAERRDRITGILCNRCKISAAAVYNRAMLQSAFPPVSRDIRRFGLQATPC